MVMYLTWSLSPQMARGKIVVLGYLVYTPALRYHSFPVIILVIWKWNDHITYSANWLYIISVYSENQSETWWSKQRNKLTIPSLFRDPCIIVSRMSEFALKLNDIDSEQVGIPETEYSAVVKMPAGEFGRVIRDLSNFGESATITVTKDGLKFSCKGDNSNGEWKLIYTTSITNNWNIASKSKKGSLYYWLGIKKIYRAVNTF